MPTIKMKNFSKISSGKQVYYLLSEETEDEDLNLTLCDGQDAWTGTVPETSLRKQSKQVKMTFSDFMDETNKALSRKNLGGLNFLYEFKEFDDSLKLSWKKHLDGIKILLGTASLDKKSDPSDVIRQMFEYSLTLSESLIKDIASLEGTNERLTSERANALKKLDKCVAAKEELEDNLFSKFVVVLNEKKAKLRELKADLENQPEASNKSAAQSTAGGGDSKSDSEGDIPVKQAQYEEDEETTDDEKEPTTKRKRGNISSSVGDDSLLLSGEDVSEPTTSTARRRRRAPTQKKTPSKPVLPKVTSSEKTTPGRPALKKTPSRQSNSSTRSSDNQDAEDLLDEF